MVATGGRTMTDHGRQLFDLSGKVALVDCNGHLYSYAIRRDGSAYDHRTGLASAL